MELSYHSLNAMDFYLNVVQAITPFVVLGSFGMRLLQKTETYDHGLPMASIEFRPAKRECQHMRTISKTQLGEIVYAE